MSGESSDSDSSSVERLLLHYLNDQNGEEEEQGRASNQDPGPSTSSNQKITASTSSGGNEAATDTLQGIQRQSAYQVGVSCAVCGDKASGFHYGVTTCEPCKAFFRRCIHEDVPAICEKGRKCLINRFTRNNCSGCRFDKCILVGMRRRARGGAQYDSDEDDSRCAVCNGKAEGLHCGVLTCNGCNLFFRRSVRDNMQYTCKNDRKCSVEYFREQKCASCRYDKCIEVGMEKSVVGVRNYKRKRKSDASRENDETDEQARGWKSGQGSSAAGQSSRRDRKCPVCGQRCRALVCQPCKRFFRRSVQSGEQYTCKKGNKCHVDSANRRSSCRSCRFKRCIEVGMKRSSVNMDRSRQLEDD